MPTRRSSSPTRGTDIDLLNYGKLDYGRHIIEYRAIDAAGNIATAKKFALTYLDPEKSEVGQVGGTVPATLSLTLGVDAGHVRGVHAGLAKDYTASMAADVVSSAGDAALSVRPPSPGKLMNGSFTLRVTAAGQRDLAAAARPGPGDRDAPDLREDRSATIR